MKMVDPNEELQITQPPQESIENKIEYWPITELPSNFQFYPKETKIFGRVLDVIEIKKIALAAQNNDKLDFVIRQVLKRAITGIETNEIIQSDKLYLLLWLRANTFNEPGYSVDFHCHKCDKEATYDFNLNNLEIKYFDNEFFNHNTVKLKNGDEIVLNHLTLRDEEQQDAFRIEFAKMEDLNDEIIDLASSIKTINGERLPLINRYTYLTNPKKIDAKDYMKLETVMNKYDFGVTPILKVKCNQCGGESLSAITFRKSFLVPEFRLQ